MTEEQKLNEKNESEVEGKKNKFSCFHFGSYEIFEV